MRIKFLALTQTSYFRISLCASVFLSLPYFPTSQKYSEEKYIKEYDVLDY